MSQRSKFCIIAGSVLLLVAAFFIPVTQQRIVTYGTDSYQTHYALFNKHPVSETVTTQGSLNGLGVILVDLHRTKQLTPVILTLSTENGQQLATAHIPVSAMHDDGFAWVSWPKPLVVPHFVRLTLEAPQATTQTALGVRFDEQTRHLALGMAEKVPLWLYFATTWHNSPNKNSVLSSLLIALLGALAIGLCSAAPLSPNWRKKIFLGALGILLVSSFAARAWAISHVYGVSGGDPYNYLFITKEITSLHNPFANTKRLPGFPLLLAPAYVTPLDDISYMEYVSAISAIAVLALTAALAAKLKLPLSVQLAAPFLLALQKDFFWTSIRPEPYTFYAMLVLLALWLFFSLEKKWVQILFGLTLGYAAMTRQEGFVLAATLGLASLAWWKSISWRAYLRIGIPMLLLMTPFFIHNTLEYGNPIFTPYFEGDRLQIVNSWTSFQDNFTATSDIFFSLWKTSWDTLSHASSSVYALCVVGVVATLAWFGLRFWKKENKYEVGISASTAGLLFIATLWLAFNATASLPGLLLPLTTGLLLISFIPFLVVTRLRGLAVLLVLISQAAIALWFHPFAKHFQQDYALVMLLLATALFYYAPAVASWKNTLLLSCTALAFLFPFTLTATNLATKLGAQLDRQNENTALDSVVYRATKFAVQQPGRVGFTQAYLPSLLYFGDAGSYFDGDEATPEQQQEWVRNEHLKTLVVVNDTSLFKMPDPTWKLLKTFKAAGKDDFIFESFVYTVSP